MSHSPHTDCGFFVFFVHAHRQGECAEGLGLVPRAVDPVVVGGGRPEDFLAPDQVIQAGGAGRVVAARAVKGKSGDDVMPVLVVPPEIEAKIEQRRQTVVPARAVIGTRAVIGNSVVSARQLPSCMILGSRSLPTPSQLQSAQPRFQPTGRRTHRKLVSSGESWSDFAIGWSFMYTESPCSCANL